MKKRFLPLTIIIIVVFLSSVSEERASANISLHSNNDQQIQVSGRIGEPKKIVIDKPTKDPNDQVTIGVDISQIPKDLPKTGSQMSSRLSIIGFLILMIGLIGVMKKNVSKSE